MMNNSFTHYFQAEFQSFSLMVIIFQQKASKKVQKLFQVLPCLIARLAICLIVLDQWHHWQAVESTLLIGSNFVEDFTSTFVIDLNRR